MPFLSVQEVSRHQFTTLQSIFLSSKRNLRAAWLSQGCSKTLAYLLASKEDFPELSPEDESPDEEPEEEPSDEEPEEEPSDEEPEEAPLPEAPQKEKFFPEEESSSS